MNIIETKRLILREWEDKDIEPFARINQDPRVLEFLLRPLSKEESSAWIKKINESCKENRFGLWAATLKTGDPSLKHAGTRLIGFIGLNIPTFKAHFIPCVEIGWRLGSQFWGHGYATEGARAILEYAFEQLYLKEIVAFTVPANTHSIRVMEKIGMKRDYAADFHHPNLPKDHPLSLHVFYRIRNEKP